MCVHAVVSYIFQIPLTLLKKNSWIANHLKGMISAYTMENLEISYQNISPNLNMRITKFTDKFLYDLMNWINCLRCWFLLSLAFFSGRHTGQSCRVQFFQWDMIWRDDAQWATRIGRKAMNSSLWNLWRVLSFSLSCISTCKKIHMYAIHKLQWVSK